MHQASDKNRTRVPSSYKNNDQMMKIRHQERGTTEYTNLCAGVGERELAAKSQ